MATWNKLSGNAKAFSVATNDELHFEPSATVWETIVELNFSLDLESVCFIAATLGTGDLYGTDHSILIGLYIDDVLVEKIYVYCVSSGGLIHSGAIKWTKLLAVGNHNVKLKARLISAVTYDFWERAITVLAAPT